MTAALSKGLPAAIAGILGVVVAWLWFQGPVLGVIAGVILAAIAWSGWNGRQRGRALLHGPGSSRDPVAAVPLIEKWTAFALAGGAFGAGLLIVLAVELAKFTEGKIDPDDKQLVTAAFGVVTALITGSLVKGLEDFGALTSEPVHSDFQTAYKGCFDSSTDEWLAIYGESFGGKEGWGSADGRRARAAFVAKKPCMEEAQPA